MTGGSKDANTIDTLLEEDQFPVDNMRLFKSFKIFLHLYMPSRVLNNKTFNNRAI